jgi:hypothetical protein
MTIALVAIVAAGIIRLLVVSTPPAYLPGGDGGEYVSLSRELLASNFAVPALNSIYYPGTQWVLPPVPVMILGALMKILGSTGWTPFEILVALCILIDVSTIIPLWRLSKALFGESAAYLVSAIYVAYPPALYTLTWTGYAPIIGFTVSVWCLLYAQKVVTLEGSSLRASVVLGILLAFEALSHDVTAFVMLGGLFLLVVGLAISRLRSSWSASVPKRGALLYCLLSLLISSPAYVYWYGDRLGWVSTVTSYQQHAGLNVAALFNQFVSSLQQPLGPLFELNLVVLLPFFVYGIYLLVRRKPTYAMAILPFLVSPAILAALTWNDPTLSILFYYYLMLFSLPFIAFAVITVIQSLSRRLNGRSGPMHPGGGRTVRIAGFVAVFVLLIVSSGTSLSFNRGSHTWFNECFECGTSGSQLFDYNALYWMANNINVNAVVVAPGNTSNYGFYVCGYDGNPCLVAHGLIWLSQSTERQESSAAQVLIYNSASNPNVTSQLIREYNVSYVMMPNLGPQRVPSYFALVYNDSSVFLYRVSGHV